MQIASYFWKRVGNGKGFQFDNLFWDKPQVYESISLYQIGDLRCESGLTLGPHKQECYEISYISSGKGRYMTNGKWYSVETGDIYVNLPGEIHDFKADKTDPFRYFYLGFTFNIYPDQQYSFMHVKELFDQIKYPIAKAKLNINIPFIGAFSEISKASELSEIMVKTYLNQIVVLTYRNFSDNWQKDDEALLQVDNIHQLIYQIINYIDTNIFNIEKLNAIADEFGYSYSYLSNIFSEEMGFTLHEYYNKKKFEVAANLLKDGQLTITEISEKLHYQSIHSFSKAFRKIIGMPPGQYKINASQEKEPG